MRERRADVVDLAAYRARRVEEQQKQQASDGRMALVPVVWWPFWVYVPVIPAG